MKAGVVAKSVFCLANIVLWEMGEMADVQLQKSPMEVERMDASVMFETEDSEGDLQN